MSPGDDPGEWVGRQSVEGSAAEAVHSEPVVDTIERLLQRPVNKPTPPIASLTGLSHDNHMSGDLANLIDRRTPHPAPILGNQHSRRVHLNRAGGLTTGLREPHLPREHGRLQCETEQRHTKPGKDGLGESAGDGAAERLLACTYTHLTSRNVLLRSVNNHRKPPLTCTFADIRRSSGGGETGSSPPSDTTHDLQ